MSESKYTHEYIGNTRAGSHVTGLLERGMLNNVGTTVCQLSNFLLFAFMRGPVLAYQSETKGAQVS